MPAPDDAAPAQQAQGSGPQGIRVSPGRARSGRYAALDVINEKTGEIAAEVGQEITEAVLELFNENDIDLLPTLAIDHVNVGPYIRNTLAADKNSNREEALLDIYRVMRPGELPTLEQAVRPCSRPRPCSRGCCSTSTAMTCRRSVA